MENIKIKPGTAFYFFFGAIAYSLIEIIWRGYTHWTMSLLGGIVVVILSKIESKFDNAPVIFKAVLGTAIITVLELIFGIIINMKLQLHVWSYDNVDNNILGQICPVYCFFWFLLCIVAFLLIGLMNNILEKKMSQENSKAGNDAENVR